MTQSPDWADAMERVKPLYLSGQHTLSELGDMVGVGRQCFADRARRLGWPPISEVKGLRHAGKAGTAAAGRSRPARALGPARRREVGRAWAVTSRQIDALEERLADLSGEHIDGTAKALALLARTLKELVAIDAAAAAMAAAAKGAAAPATVPSASARTEEKDDIPRDMDEFRRELVRRIERLHAQREAAGPDGGADREGGANASG
jgi:hypothetical protein